MWTAPHRNISAALGAFGSLATDSYQRTEACSNNLTTCRRTHDVVENT